MIAHKAITYYFNVIVAGKLFQLFQEEIDVRLGREYSLPAIATVYHMIVGSRIFNS
jgi:hypothetical protein